MSYFFPKKPLVGLSIQPHSIQLIELKDKDTQSVTWHQERFDGEFFDDFSLDHKLTQSIEALIEKAKPSTNQVALYIPHYLVKEDSIIVPLYMKEQEICKEIDARIEANFPNLSNAVYYDFVREKDMRRRQEKIHFVFARKCYLQQLIAITQNAGLDIQVIDTEQQTLKRIWHYLATKHHNLNGLLSLSHKRAFLLLFKNNIPFISEEIEWLGDIKQLNQFLNLIANSKYQTELRLLLVGDSILAQKILDHSSTFNAFFQLLPLWSEKSLRVIEQTDFYIAFGLALRQLNYARI